ncbi:LysM peptidoglycan-binding domain-containing protein [Flavobacteriaceae bacterium]|nr:LysM peptidoglycan-binding domain-containing protein [Flavobacteriaceae bacterium]MDB4112686.1 LysM peptidoglycan-binding domain-containing protein [Flavobacteriaceae bacterium]MDB4187250.1 LysM peptidoglycan-binding domain-containing protein [Flavobacteriaceae bacterium]MDB9821690.1 LysM peptidoglycan-binding domain-containing protein [Flavobacteriaceae bacterium]MDB9823774.1 LysM peptidoglycan-binding domain-containing protein [Flavobacteriaceae bacterium]
MRAVLFFIGFLFITSLYGQEAPERFITHKVKKKETLYGLARIYNINVDQILAFNPLVEKIGLKKKMQLKIPVYPIVEVPKAVALNEGLEKYLVQPKETKWRLAYRYGVTIQELETLNPQITDGLKVGQEIVVPKRLESETKALEEEFNYYKVKPKEGFYRIEKKLGVTEADLIMLNPTLITTGLQQGMILKIPLQKTGDLRIEDDLLIEKVRLEDSLLTNTYLQIAAFLPFKTAAIEFDSIEKTDKLLEKRNIHTIALDFYMGMEMAIAKADSLGVTTKLTVFDSQNDKAVIQSVTANHQWEGTSFVIGPLIPGNFNVAAQLEELQSIPMIAPLSSKAVKKRPNVFQSVSVMSKMRSKMMDYLDQVIDTTQNVMIIADTLNADFASKLQLKYPFASRVYQEPGGFVIPDLVDSLLIDSLPNKVIFESQDLNLAANVISLLNSQVSKDRDVQLFTTMRTSIYDNTNISRKHLGNLRFTYTSGAHPKDNVARAVFKDAFQKRFGDYPSKEAYRAYDVTLDVILRFAYQNTLFIPSLGETDYVENRFLYEEDSPQGFQNTAFYLLQHEDYEIKEIKK